MALSAGADQNQTTSRILNKLQYAVTDIAADITTATTSDIVLMFDASDGYEPKYADSANVFELMGITATAAELNGAADVSSRLVSITDATTYTALAADSGKMHVFPDLTASCTVTLPAVAAGLEFTFIGKGVATDAQNWIFNTGSATNFYLGGLQFLDSDEPGSGSTLVPVYPDGDSNDIMTIITPQAGTHVYMICDGTNWIINGTVYSATAPTFAD